MIGVLKDGRYLPFPSLGDTEECLKGGQKLAALNLLASDLLILLGELLAQFFSFTAHRSSPGLKRRAAAMARSERVAAAYLATTSRERQPANCMRSPSCMPPASIVWA